MFIVLTVLLLPLFMKDSSLRDQLDEQAGEACMWSDLLSTAFYRINWVEVSENNQD